MNYLYSHMVNQLKSMDGKQLTELFHDINDLVQVAIIGKCAMHFVEDKPTESEYEEWKKENDARRGREHKSDKRPY
jgi:hypothetical protein